MSGFFDDQSIDIPCPGCGHKTTKKIAWLQSNGHYTCLCGTRIDLKSDEFKRELTGAERAIEDFRRSLRNFGR